jgi:hypothetical protein
MAVLHVQVHLCGSFTRWVETIPMAPVDGTPGVFAVVVHLPPGCVSAQHTAALLPRCSADEAVQQAMRQLVHQSHPANLYAAAAHRMVGTSRTHAQPWGVPGIHSAAVNTHSGRVPAASTVS